MQVPNTEHRLEHSQNRHYNTFLFVRHMTHKQQVPELDARCSMVHGLALASVKSGKILSNGAIRKITGFLFASVDQGVQGRA